MHLTQRGKCRESIGIFHHGREEVHGLDDTNIIGNFINSCVIGAVEANQQIGIKLALRQLAQNMAQDPWA